MIRLFAVFQIVCIVILFASLVIGCSTKKAGNEVDFRLHDIWALEFINGEEFIMGEQETHPVIEIYLVEGRVHGNAGCNNINGKVIVNENKITFSEMITTEMACPGDLEQRFLTALQNVDNYKIEKLRLYLCEGGEERLVLRKID
jgi:heat shock protein HslJ